jgi:hypothetical protein
MTVSFDRQCGRFCYVRQGDNPVEKLAPVLKTSASWLIDGVGDQETEPAPPRTTPIVGAVGAGSATILYSEGDHSGEWVSAPDGATDKTVALEIRGSSLGLSFDGWLLFYDDVRAPVTPDLIGRLCVVCVVDGRVLVKNLKAGQLPGRYNLLSNTEPPIYDVQVHWAARVKQMTPR